MLKKDDRKFILKGLLIWLTSLLVYEGRHWPSFFRMYQNQPQEAVVSPPQVEHAQVSTPSMISVKACPPEVPVVESSKLDNRLKKMKKKRRSVGRQSEKKRGKKKIQKGEKINVNKASRQELVRLPGVGAAIAERIIAYRSQKGLFRQLKELQNVKGLGKKKLNLLADHITFK